MLGVAQPFGLATPPFIIEPFFLQNYRHFSLIMSQLLSNPDPLRWAPGLCFLLQSPL